MTNENVVQHIAECYAAAFTIDDMRRFAGEAWGQLGIKVVERWCEYKVTYFDGALQPVPRALTGLLCRSDTNDTKSSVRDIRTIPMLFRIASVTRQAVCRLVLLGIGA
jgi:hypothetical protein